MIYWQKMSEPSNIHILWCIIVRDLRRSRSYSWFDTTGGKGIPFRYHAALDSYPLVFLVDVMGNEKRRKMGKYIYTNCTRALWMWSFARWSVHSRYRTHNRLSKWERIQNRWTYQGQNAGHNDLTGLYWLCTVHGDITRREHHGLPLRGYWLGLGWWRWPSKFLFQSTEISRHRDATALRPWYPIW